MLGVCYRKPSSNVEFWETLQDSVDIVKAYSDCLILLCGDLNADPCTENGPKMRNLATQNHFTIHVKLPTRITASSASILDLVLRTVSNKLFWHILNLNVKGYIHPHDMFDLIRRLRFPLSSRHFPM